MSEIKHENTPVEDISGVVVKFINKQYSNVVCTAVTTMLASKCADYYASQDKTPGVSYEVVEVKNFTKEAI